MGEQETPYKNIKSELILRDHLAADRTILANERTFLAYIRTALTLFIAGLSFVHFDILNSPWADGCIGGSFMLIGIVTFVLGFYRYNHKKKIIREIKHRELAEGIKHGN